MNIEDDPSTWEYELQEHWKVFTDFAWNAFSHFEEITRKTGHENKIDKMKWRDYLLWDMQRRHEMEKDSE